ncbi:DNA/RNA non-specific endonuclease [Roseovarius aestuarii]|uniref:Endonuclease n=1 Tax=Roseovarius aestuarii TaxID=475083 RepID=A0A1X7BWY9_9RHOB|nr:DNA/RNA non-specific endonuclease [Roseovarius aestuarii]SMC14020.1 Nuclease precursor [Roseovarius aestuarii]
MDDPFQIQRELRYGAPVCDQVLTGRHFTIGYSWYFRQAKWVLEIIKPNETLLDIEYADGDRLDNFRPDQRIPRRFRASLEAYKGSGFDRGHLAASANLNETDIQNSETFLLSNMSPQLPNFNRKIWRDLEIAVRELNEYHSVLETYVLTAPVFDFEKKIEVIGDKDNKYGIDIPIPHAFVKSVLAEKRNGEFILSTFKIDNEEQDADLRTFLEKTYDVEQYVGGRFWDRVSGGDLHKHKEVKGEMWIRKEEMLGPWTQAKLSSLKEELVVDIAIMRGLDASVDDRKSDTIEKILAS